MRDAVELWSPEKTVAGWIENAPQSLRMIEAATGVSRSKLSKLSGGSATLTVSDLASICACLGRDPRDVFQRSMSLDAVDGAYTTLGSKLGAAVMDTAEHRAKSGDQSLTIEDVIAWHDVTDGHLYRAEEIRHYMVAFKPVNDITEKLEVVDVGRKSLAWSKVQAAWDAPVRPKDIEEFVASNIAGQARGAILEGYIDTHSSQSRQYYDRKLLHMSGNGQALVTSYFTILLAGRWHDDAPVIWNFSKEISTRVASGDELAELRGYLGAE
jgi:DNA-binding Xre family transcriptional regulator